MALEPIANVASDVQALVALGGAPGAAIAIKQRDQLTLVPLGTVDWVGSVPLPATARFPLYSVTKTYIAVLVLRLVDAGLVTLDQPVRLTLDVPALDARITVRHLLTHTSGIRDYGADPHYVADLRRDPTVPWTAAEFLDQVLGQGLAFAPGAGWRYANVGYLLLRQLVERVTGHAFAAAVRTHIGRPLGLSATGVLATLDDMTTVTPGWSRYLAEPLQEREQAGEQIREREDVRGRYHPGWVSHGLIGAPAAEVATVLDALLAGELVSAKARAEMLTGVDVPGTDPRIRHPQYGLGLMIDGDRTHGIAAGHNGGGPGWSTSAFHFSGERMPPTTIVALVNSDESDAAALVFRCHEWLVTRGGLD